MRWEGLRLWKNDFLELKSKGAIKRILKALLPKMLPIAKSMEPMRQAAMLETSSGKEVHNANKVVPIKESPSLVIMAISAAELAT